MPQDLDPVETREWLDALDSVLEFGGMDRAGFLLQELVDGARRNGAPVPYSATTPYLNTISLDRQAPHPGDREIEHRIRSLIRWNAVAIVLRANKESSELGGHIASFQSAATLYDTGFQHFWHAPSPEHGGDLVFVIPSVAYTDPEVAWVGVTENEARAAGVKYGKGVFPWAASGRSLSLGRDEGITKVLFDETTERIIGCGIVGPHAGDLIAEAALAIELGADAADIGLTEAFEGTITDLYLPKKK